uniref:Uncharacterized protein n=1 Tax=Chloropicon primus TaxID=1764295 RepID=A0A7S2T6M9_9CHLO
MTGRAGPRGGWVGLVVALCALCFLADEASGIKFRMFPQLNQKECVSESVSENQWELVLESVEANFRKNAKRNLTDQEIAVRLASFRRPVLIEIGFLTMSPNPSDQTMKPVDYVITDDRGNMLSTRTSITQEEVEWKSHVGGKGASTMLLLRGFQLVLSLSLSVCPPISLSLSLALVLTWVAHFLCSAGVERSLHHLLHGEQGVRGCGG